MKNVNMLDEKVCEKIKKMSKILKKLYKLYKMMKKLYNCTTALYTEKFPKKLESTAKPLTDGHPTVVSYLSGITFKKY